MVLQDVTLFWYNVSYNERHFYTLSKLCKGESSMSTTHSLLLRNLGMQEINPIQAGWENCSPGHSFGPALRPFLLLHYVVSGRGEFFVGEKSYQVSPGQIFVIRPGETTYYQASKTDPWRYIWIGFEAGIPLPAALKEDVLTLPQAGPLFSGVPELSRRESGREASLCGKIWQLLSLLEEETSRSQREKPADEYVNKAKTYMETEYMRGVSVAALAGKLNLDRSYFSKLFKAATGKSPQQYLTGLRMEKAAELLREYGKAPGEAAAASGYPDVFSFSRMFKRYFGVSPREYQKSTSRPLP